jgi:hypothetical protein
MMRVFAGYDPRESIGFHVFCQSVLEHSSVPVAITPLHLPNLNGYKDSNTGTNAFNFSRFLTPWICGWSGWALFADGADMLCRADLAELWSLRDPLYAVQVVKHDYRSRHPRKYLGTCMEAENLEYPKKNWSSLMLINCCHLAWRAMTPEHIEKATGSRLHQFQFVPERYIGDLPLEWNWLVGEYPYSPSAKIAHFTLGIPGFKAYESCDYAGEWHQVVRRVSLLG